MEPQEHKVELELGGQTLSISTGKMAKLAAGSAVVRLGDTVVLVATAAAKTPTLNRDFVPLTVDYRERTYAAGKIPGGFFKREGRPTEKEVLSSRLIDRPIRPLFSKAFPYETQVMATVMSSDQENDADVLALIGASAAMCLSDIPFPEPVAAVRVGRAAGELIVMPTVSQLEDSCREVAEQDMVAALKFAMEHIRRLVGIQTDLVARCGKPKRALLPAPDVSALKNELERSYRSRLRDAIRIPGKEARQEEIDRTVADAVAAF